MKRSLLILLFITALLKAAEYKIGSGIQVGKLPVYAGGYITIDQISRSDNYNRLRIDDIAFITYGDYGHFSYLTELEIKNGYVKEWGKRDRTKTNMRLNIERLYLNYTHDDKIEINLGKFNTPVGYWNLTPIGVLRDSASNPYLAYILYPRYTTGIQISYEDHLNNGNAYTLMVQNSNDLDDNYNNIIVDRHNIIGIEHIGEEISYKANIGYFRTTSNEDFYYFLLSLLYEKERYKISAEYGARRDNSRWSVPYAFYTQGVYYLAPKHDLIARLESYKIDEGAKRHENIGVIGYTYRPISPMTYKIEYQLRSYTNESQFKLSFSILF